MLCNDVKNVEQLEKIIDIEQITIWAKNNLLKAFYMLYISWHLSITIL